MTENSFTIKRKYRATPQEIWELWTTADGVESWWGPEGFRVRVIEIKAEVGGKMEYEMIAMNPDIIRFLEKEGLPTVTRHEIRFTVVIPFQKIEFSSPIDFIPGIKPYTTTTKFELIDQAPFVEIVLTGEKMHDDQWTDRALAGWTSQMEKLAELLNR